MSVPWCRREWWDDTKGLLTFDDWQQVDAMYRSRALEFPGIGECMIPCIDMANHASGYGTIARYECGQDGSAQLLLREDNRLKAGDEVTITYGDDKGACEMVFSYGFLEDTMASAGMLLLDLAIPDDDPLKKAKQYVSTSAPGVRVFEGLDGPAWTSEYIWLVVINEEDGLSFQVVESTNGEQHLMVFWQNEPMASIDDLPGKLLEDRHWPIFKLRAVCLIWERVQQQLGRLGEASAVASTQSLAVRGEVLDIAKRLRHLEQTLLKAVVKSLEADVRGLINYVTQHGVSGPANTKQKSELANTELVREFLQRANSTQSEEDDFS